MKETCIARCESADELRRNERAVLQKCGKDVVRNEMLLKNRMSSRLNLPGGHQLPADEFGLCDLLPNGGIVCTIAKATTLSAMNDLSFAIKVPGAE